MNSEQLTASNSRNLLEHIKIMNKLGASFFIMFIIAAVLPLVDLGAFSTETISLYSLVEPTFLMVLATVGVLVYLSGISRTAARAVSFIFVAIVVVQLLSQLYDAYDLYKSVREMSGGTVKFKYFVRHISETLRGFESLYGKPTFSLILLIVSFFGIVGGIFSPRYKENKQLKAVITGQEFELTETDISADADPKSKRVNKSEVLVKAKILVNKLIKKVIETAKYTYQIVKPLVNSLLDKGTDIVCQQQPQLKRGQVKMVLGGLLILLIYLVVF